MLPLLQHYKGLNMPTYNYYCSNCDSHFSYFQKMSESPILHCESCGGSVKRLITGGTGLIFKGTGFYLTDYKVDKKSVKMNSNSEKSDEKKSSEGGKKDSRKKETKPAANTENKGK